MDLKTKMQLLKLTECYWTLLPPEIKEIILEYKESQEFIERRESASNHALCKQIKLYGQLRQKWQIGHIQCRPMNCNPGVKCEYMQIYSFYIDLRGRIQKSFLGVTIEQALAYCDYRRNAFGNVRLYDVDGMMNNDLWVVRL